MLDSLVLLVFVEVVISLFDEPEDEKSLEIVGISIDGNGVIDGLKNAVESKLGKSENGLLFSVVTEEVVGLGDVEGVVSGGVIVVVTGVVLFVIFLLLFILSIIYLNPSSLLILVGNILETLTGIF